MDTEFLNKARFALNPSQDGFINFSEVGVGDEATYVVFDEDYCNWHGVPYEDPIGLLLVKMESENRIKVEVFAYDSSLDVEFTNSARTYYR